MAASGGRTRQAVFLIGGKGTRLGDLAKDTPKPLLPLNDGRPFLDLLIENAVRQGFDRVLLLAGHLGEVVRQTYEGRRVRGAEVSVVVESSPQGTGGALRVAQDRLEETFLLANGDTFFDTNLRALEQGLNDDADGLAFMALRHVDSIARYGAVSVRDGRVTAFEEKRGIEVPGLINAGSYLVRRTALYALPTGPSSFEQDLLPQLADKGQLGARPTDGYFIDIGLPETLHAARDALRVDRRRPALFLDRDGVINVDHGYVHQPGDVTFVDGAIDTIRAANDAGWFVFVVTNQAGIARGFYTEETMHALHNWMQDAFARVGAFVDAFYHCPFHPEGIVPAFTGNHPDRKPGPGMILRAMAEWPVDPKPSFLVGDRTTDIEAANAAGLRGLLFPGGNLSAFVAPEFGR